MPFFGFKTVPEGQRVCLWSHSGHAKIVDGPQRLTLFRSSVESLRHHIAGQGQYLRVTQKNGEIFHISGPSAMFFNPLEHKTIITEEAIFINANEALVIYQNPEVPQNHASPQTLRSFEKEDKVRDDKVKRIVRFGPAQFVPQPNEWIHEFVWHGSKGDDKTHKHYGALKFTKLRVIADQMYYNVREVRTKDDTLITVKLMLFFELKDVNLMLDNTHDPVADFVNAAASDTVAFCSHLTYEEFLESTDQLNELDTFKHLCSRSKNIGYQVNKVVFRGFHSTDALQSMHDQAIQERTKMKLSTNTEYQRQKHLDFQLEKQAERAVEQRKLDKSNLNHEEFLTEQTHKQELSLSFQRAEHESKIRLMKTEHELWRLKEMAALKIDLTKVLVAQTSVPNQHIKLDCGENPTKDTVHTNLVFTP
eukprot:maker-scaffold415_size178368-snap-gene-0.32 protein:Tk01173 transcript:maker-scaffold415_size178368-snap-gene-0.32-mRNA-1 annotation:"hypothetical protein CAOG_00454"